MSETSFDQQAWLAEVRADDQPRPEPATLGDVVTELRRIADALTGAKCYGVHDGQPCVLAPRHVGHHTTADGRQHWLDEE